MDGRRGSRFSRLQEFSVSPSLNEIIVFLDFPILFFSQRSTDANYRLSGTGNAFAGIATTTRVHDSRARPTAWSTRIQRRETGGFVNVSF